jgi:hypothetical protein
MPSDGADEDGPLQDLNTVRNSLAKQADAIITEETTWVELVRELDVSQYKTRDGYPEWHDATPFDPMLISYLWAKTEDESLSGIPSRLAERDDLAAAFGFTPGDLPDESTFTPKRLERNRFEDLQGTVERAAQHIRNVAAERGAPIGPTVMKKSYRDNDEDNTPSKRDLNRMLRWNSNEVLSELKHVAFPAIELERSDDALYPDQELLTVEGIGAIKNNAANNSGEILGDLKNPHPDLDDPYTDDGPSGETLLEAIKDLSVDQIATVMNFALRKTYTRAKPRLQELEHVDGKRFGTRAKVAMDITYVAYYGDREGLDRVQGSPDDKEYEWCHKFATITIVGENTHYVISVVPLGSTEYADTEAYAKQPRSYYIGDVARRLLTIANQYVNIDTVYADREFFAVDVIWALQARGLDYVIPAVKNKRVKQLCEKFDSIKRGFDEENDVPLYVDDEYAMYGRVKNQPSNTRVETNLVILPPGDEDPARSKRETQPFVTNKDMSNEIALDRRWTHKQIQEYNTRAAIETSYTSIKECAAWTTSKEFEVRWFHFAFACLVYNIWLLVDFLVQERIGVIETRRKPRITLQRFLDKLEKELKELL